MASPAIELNRVVKTYGGKTVVDALSLTVPRGQCFGLLGPNGAGKTTTMRMLLGMAPADAGTIAVLGSRIPAYADLARTRVGVVPQFDNLDLELSVRENLLVFGRYFGMSARKIASVIPELLEFACLESKADARVTELSGGMKRRLTLVRALVNDPDLLVLDEPTTGLDPQTRHLIWGRLRELVARGKTIFLTTHFMEEAERMCDALCVLEKGRKIAEGRPSILIEEQIGADVIEIYGPTPPGLHARIAAHAAHIESAGTTLFCYAPDVEAVRRELRGCAGLRFAQRPANLEDVFLRLTGRELRD